jgi:hypothetical protein
MTVRRVLVSMIVVGLLAAATGSATYAAISRATRSDGNELAVGTVSVGDNDAGVALLKLSSALPNATDTGCIRVTYAGSLDADVRLYAAVSGALAPYLTLTVTRGTEVSPTFDSCASFSPDATDYRGAGPGVVYAGPLSAYPTVYATGILDPPSGTREVWSQAEQHSYRLMILLNNDAAAQGQSATATFTWEARNL